MASLYVDGEILVDYVTRMIDGHIKYDLGSKANWTDTPESITQIDCSGFTRYILYQTSQVKLGGGSSLQHEWMEKQGFPKVKYDDVGATKDNMLRVGYYPKPGDLPAGHIWFILNGMTIESYAGGDKHGPGRRPWDTGKLRAHVKHVYEIGYIKKYVDTGPGPFGQCQVVNMDVSNSFE